MACTYYHGISRAVDVQIYSLKSDSWRSINCLDNKQVGIYRPDRFVNGKIYFVNCNSFDRYLIYIDLLNEKWQKMEQPTYGEGDYDLQLGLYGSDLCGYINNWEKFMSLWVMKESWTKIFTINYAEYPSWYALPFSCQIKVKLWLVLHHMIIS